MCCNRGSVERTVGRKREASLRIASFFISVWLLVFSSKLLAIEVLAVEDECARGASSYNSSGILKSVVDGDTIKLNDGRKIRLIGINTPELARKQSPAEPLAKQAKRYLSQLLPVGKQVQLRLGSQGKDRYGRVLAHVFSENGSNVTADLLANGYGFQVLIAPNDWGRSCYGQSEKKARDNKVGVWVSSYYKVRAANSGHFKGGFTLISGEIERVSNTKKTIWIDLKGEVTLKISQHRWKDFQKIKSVLKPGTMLETRGWLIDRKKRGKAWKKQYKRWMMPISHPGSLNLLD